MPVVVKRHRLSADGGLQGLRPIGQGRQGKVGHHRGPVAEQQQGGEAGEHRPEQGAKKHGSASRD